MSKDKLGPAAGYTMAMICLCASIALAYLNVRFWGIYVMVSIVFMLAAFISEEVP